MLLRFSVIILVGLTLNGDCTASGRKSCRSLLQSLKENPPTKTLIAINIHLSKARYRCAKGFKLVGEPMRTCRRGTWIEKESPKCVSKRSCGQPEPILHATYKGSRFDFKSKLLYSCEQGYKLTGPAWRRCGGKRKWSKAPKCTRIQCPSARNLKVPNGNVTTTDSNYYYGATLMFECNEGYELRGPDVITCLEYGWIPLRKPYCVKSACPEPERPENGDRYGFFTIGSTVRFSCQSGFELHGSEQRTCLENKEWTGNLTTCQDGTTDCPVLGKPISGRKEGQGYNRGNIVKFECNSGFVLKGSAVRECLQNGTWNGTEAICKNELEESFKDVNSTAFSLRRNVLDTLLEHTCENDTCSDTEANLDTRGRAINLNDEGGLDLVFVIDASSSVKKANFDLSLKFAKEIVREIGSSKRYRGTRLAAVSFGTEPKLEFNLGDAKADTKEKAIDAIGNITYVRGGTASSLALKTVRDVVLPMARKSSYRAMIFITDGMSNIGGAPETVAGELRKKPNNFDIYAIGIGAKAVKTELYKIASARRNVILIRSYKELVEAVKKAVKKKIDYSSCGESPAELRARIVGGTDSFQGMWPWQVGIEKVNMDNELHLKCGGALLSSRWVLTAAHCFFVAQLDPNGKWLQKRHDSPNRYRIVVGDHSLSEYEASQEKIQLAEIFIHQKFHTRNLTNDIALVKLLKEVKLGKYVRTLCLPKHEEKDLAIAGKYGIVSGWGVTQVLQKKEKPKKKNKNSDVLQYSAFEIQSDELCVKNTEHFVNSSVTFCAGDGKRGNDTCQGDSGGAFVREGKRDDGYRWVASGIVSWGVGCGLKDHFGYYTRVYPFIDWIRSTMRH